MTTKMEKANTKATNYEQVNCNIKPTKTIDSGSHGKAFEMRCKMYLNGGRGNIENVSSKGKKDMQYKGLTIECKSGCGTLDKIEQNDYIIYSYDSTIDNARVFTVEQFMNALNNCNLIRTKKATNGNIVTCIQSFKNSKKKFAMWLEALTIGMSLDEFKAMV